MKILIATGIYPPDIGGPARYAKELADAIRGLGHEVKILPYRLERKLPFGIRQLWYLMRCLFSASSAEAIIALDTVSVGFPAVVASFLTGKKVAVRTGGDFLWEAFLERTGFELPLPAFYKIMPPLSFREKLIEKIHQFLLDYTDFIVFSTAWQRDIWSSFYAISEKKVRIIENCYHPKRAASAPDKKIFLGSARDIVMKNLDNVREAFAEAKKKMPELELDLKPYPPEEYDQKLRTCYAVVIASLGDISPNSIIEAVSFDKPFILTKYNGIEKRLGGAGLIVDPLDIGGITSAFLRLSKKEEYDKQLEKVRKITFTHSYEDIAKEFLILFS